MKTSYLKKLDKLPPHICLLIARDGHRRPISMEDIARTSGFSMSKVRRIARSKTWANVTITDADALRAACGIYPHNEAEQMKYLRRTLRSVAKGGGLAHLDRRAASTQKFLLQLIRSSRH